MKPEIFRVFIFTWCTVTTVLIFHHLWSELLKILLLKLLQYYWTVNKPGHVHKSKKRIKKKKGNTNISVPYVCTSVLLTYRKHLGGAVPGLCDPAEFGSGRNRRRSPGSVLWIGKQPVKSLRYRGDTSLNGAPSPWRPAAPRCDWLLACWAGLAGVLPVNRD